MGLKFQEVKRMVLLNANLYDNLVDDLNQEIGLPVWNILFEASRNSGKSSLEEMLSGRGFLKKAADFRVFRRMIIRSFNELAILMGFGSSKTEKIIPGEGGIAYVKNPFNLYTFTGAIVAAFEALDGIPYECTWKEISLNEFQVTCTNSESKSFAAPRLEEKVPVVVEGNIKLARCPRCNCPDLISQLLEWKYNDGIIINRKSGDRVCVLASTTLVAVFRELAEELGDEIYDSLISSQRKWTVAQLHNLNVASPDSTADDDKAKTAFLKYLEDFPVFGYGNPTTLDIHEDFCSITIENPFFVEMLAGTILGLFEGLFSRKGHISWEIKDHKVNYSIKKLQ